MPIPWRIVFPVAAGMLLWATYLLLTFAVSQTQKTAANAVFRSAVVETRTGPVNSVLLTGFTFKYRGTSGCLDFSYFVLGNKGIGFAKVRIKSENSPVKSWKVLELVGTGGDFEKYCWNRN